MFLDLTRNIAEFEAMSNSISTKLKDQNKPKRFNTEVKALMFYEIILAKNNFVDELKKLKKKTNTLLFHISSRFSIIILT